MRLKVLEMSVNRNYILRCQLEKLRIERITVYINEMIYMLNVIWNTTYKTQITGPFASAGAPDDAAVDAIMTRVFF